MSERGKLNWVCGAFMDTTPEYIPVANKYEVALVAALVRQGRTFLKPLRYASEDETPPDFMLIDTTPPVTMQVMAGTQEALQLRQEQKLGYEQQGHRLWMWDTTSTERIPAFPIDRA